MQCIQGEGLAHDQTYNAIKKAFGEDRVITEIGEEAAWLGRSFPKGATYFHVDSASSECTHDPRCSWHDHVFHYKDRCIVLTMAEMHRTSLAAVIEALKEGSE